MLSIRVRGDLEGEVGVGQVHALAIPDQSGPAQTLGSLEAHRGHVAEFARLWSSTYDAGLSAIAAVLGATGLFRRRRESPILETAFLVLSGVLAMSAIRGVPFLMLAGMGSYSRSLASSAAAGPAARGLGRELSPSRFLGVLAACLIGTFILNERWVVGARGLGGPQFGLGKALGAWPDRATAFVRTNPPNGQMLNLTWYSGNALVWELYPQAKVFVDARFEAYPRRFLLDVVDAVDRPEVLDRFLSTYTPGWLFLETAFSGPRHVARRLIASGQWSLIYADSMALVLVSIEQNADLARRSPVALGGLTPADLDPREDIAALQWIRWAGLMRTFELFDGERQALEQARSRADGFPIVKRALSQYPAATP